MYIKQLDMTVNWIVYQENLKDGNKTPIGAFIMESDAEAFVKTLGQQCSAYRVYIKSTSQSNEGEEGI